jgi:hypothetical protein
MITRRRLLVCGALVMSPVAHSKEKEPPPLRGSAQSLPEENAMADLEELTRLDEKSLAKFKERGLLVRIPESEWLQIDEEKLLEPYRWVRPFVRDFLVALGEEHYRKFKKPLVLTSAVRSQEYQKGLRGKNGNAAGWKTGPKQSTHLTGATIDITKKPMSDEQVRWMRVKLKPLMDSGKIHVIEEFKQIVFHIQVSKKFKHDRM